MIVLRGAEGKDDRTKYVEQRSYRAQPGLREIVLCIRQYLCKIALAPTANTFDPTIKSDVRRIAVFLLGYIRIDLSRAGAVLFGAR